MISIRPSYTFASAVTCSYTVYQGSLTKLICISSSSNGIQQPIHSNLGPVRGYAHLAPLTSFYSYIAICIYIIKNLNLGYILMVQNPSRL